jgi:hypothetical protein
MLYAAVILALLGVAIGATFRLRFLVGMLLPVMGVALIFAWSQAHNFKEGLLVVVSAVVILQVGYFVGLSVRPFVTYAKRKLVRADSGVRHWQHDRDGQLPPLSDG